MARFSEPAFMQGLHKWACVFWLAMIVPTLLWLTSSVPYLVALSVYAILVGHWGSWQAVRVETKQDAAMEEADKTP